jgi:hypothetical protein
MAPILASRGGISARAYGLFGGVAPLLGDYQAITTATVDSGGSSSITFSAIPSTFKHLQIRCITHASGGTQPAMLMTFNSTSTGYYWHGLEGSGSGAGYAYDAGSLNSGIYIYSTAGTNFGSNVFSGHIIDIFDYANTSKNKTTRSIGGEDGNGSGYVTFNSGLWQSTNAISSVNIALVGGYNFAQYTQFALYGIKG